MIEYIEIRKFGPEQFASCSPEGNITPAGNGPLYRGADDSGREFFKTADEALIGTLQNDWMTSEMDINMTDGREYTVVATMTLGLDENDDDDDDDE